MSLLNVLKLVKLTTATTFMLIVYALFIKEAIFSRLPDSFQYLNIPKTGHLYLSGLESNKFNDTSPPWNKLYAFEGIVYRVYIKVSNQVNRCWKSQYTATKERWLDIISDAGKIFHYKTTIYLLTKEVILN